MSNGFVKGGIGSVRSFLGGLDPGSQAGPGLVAQKLGGGNGALGSVLAEFLIEDGVIEAGARGVRGAATKVNRVNARPVDGRKTHRAGLATGVELAAVKREGAEGLAGGANGVHFGVRGGIDGSGNGVHALADYLAVPHDDGSEGTAAAADDVFRGQRDSVAQEAGIW